MTDDSKDGRTPPVDLSVFVNKGDHLRESRRKVETKWEREEEGKIR